MQIFDFFYEHVKFVDSAIVQKLSTQLAPCSSPHRCIVKTTPDSFTLCRDGTAVRFIALCDGFSQCNSDLDLTGSNNIGPRATEGRGITQMVATCKNAQVRVKDACLPYDLCGVLDVGAKDKAAGGSNVSLFKRPPPPDVAIHSCEPIVLEKADRAKIEFDYRDCYATVAEEPVYGLADRAVTDQNAPTRINNRALICKRCDLGCL